MKFIGIDLHINCFTCCFLDLEDGKRVQTFKITSEGLEAFYSLLDLETYCLVEATMNTFSFAALFEDKVKEVIVANTFTLKQISFTNKKTDKVDAEKLARILKVQVISGEEQVNRVTIPPKQIQDLRALFATYRLLRKQVVCIKNRIHSLLKQNLYPYTKEYIFGKKSRKIIRKISTDDVLNFQLNLLFDELDNIEDTIEKLKLKIKLEGSHYFKEINILTSMKGLSVFTAIAIVSDIVTVKRFPNSKKFSCYLRSAPRVSSSNEKTIIQSTNKMGRKLSITLLSQALNHVRNSSPKLSSWYYRLTKYKKPGLVRMGLCRRVITEIYQMLKKEEYHYYRNIENHTKKIKEYCDLLENNGINIGELKLVA